MADTTFSAGTTVASLWLKDVNRNTYKDQYNVKNGPYSATGDGSTDDRAALQAAIDAAISSGSKVVNLPKGTYKITSSHPSTTFECPRDDGSYSSTAGWVGETTIAAESATTMPIGLYIPSYIELVGESPESTIIEGDWTYSSSNINTSQRIGILIGNSKDNYQQIRIRNITLKNFFIPFIVQGTLTASSIDNVSIDGSAFSTIQAVEGNTYFNNMQFIRSYGGLIIGGWWLHRNRALAASNMPSSFGGSYPATDIFRACWADNWSADNIEWTAQPVFDARADSIDTFFDTYFFKSTNSAVYPTGRATVNSDALFAASAGYPTYRGVFGTGIAFMSRGGRYNVRQSIGKVVSSGNSRPFLYAHTASNFSITGPWYFENSALVDPTAGGGVSTNRMGVDRADPYHAGAPTSLSTFIEFEGGGGTYINSVSGANNASAVPVIESARRYNMQSGIRSSAVQEFLSGVRFNDSESVLSRYFETTFTPALLVGATTQTGITIDRANYQRFNNTYHFTLQLSKATLTISGTGNITITGLPVSFANGGFASVTYFSMVTSATLQVFGFINGSTIELHKAANRGAPLTHADLTNGALVLTISGIGYA